MGHTIGIVQLPQMALRPTGRVKSSNTLLIQLGTEILPGGGGGREGEESFVGTFIISPPIIALTLAFLEKFHFQATDQQRL